MCYSHSSYFAEIPSQYLTNGQGQYVDRGDNVALKDNKVTNPAYIDYRKIWGESLDGNNTSTPVLIKPTKAKPEDKFDENPF